MALPKLVTPEYTLTLPSNKQKVKYRPYLVKEEKVLLTAMETAIDEEKSVQNETIRNSTITVINECTFNKVDLNALPEFDIEYLFLNIRAKSRGEIVKPVYTCKQKNEKEELCNTDVEIEVDLTKVKVDFPKEDFSKIMLSDTVGIQFKYLDSASTAIHDKVPDEVEKMFRIMVDSIDYIFDEEKIYKGSETPKKELLDFIEQMDEKTFEKVKKFFDNTPALRKVLKFKCPKCGYKQDITVEGLEDFFDLA
jgi:rubrerythrin